LIDSLNYFIELSSFGYCILILFQINALWFIEQKRQVNCLNNVCYVLYGLTDLALCLLLYLYYCLNFSFIIEYIFYFIG